MTITKIFIFLGCASLPANNTITSEPPKKNQNQDTYLTWDTNIYGESLKERTEEKGPEAMQSCRTEVGKNQKRAEATPIFLQENPGHIKKTNCFLSDAMSYIPNDDEYDQKKNLKKHIKHGTALLCTNVSIEKHFLTSELEWRDAILFGSKDKNDCEALRKFLKKRNQAFMNNHQSSLK